MSRTYRNQPHSFFRKVSFKNKLDSNVKFVEEMVEMGFPISNRDRKVSNPHGEGVVSDQDDIPVSSYREIKYSR